MSTKPCSAYYHSLQNKVYAKIMQRAGISRKHHLETFFRVTYAKISALD
jgi:hypothetical protein